MILKKLKLLNFRNLDKIELDVSAQINIFLGRNGQGKTNLLEGLNYLALGRSHRGSLDRDLIGFGHDHTFIAVEGETGKTDRFRLEASFTREGKKQIKVDGDVSTRRADLVGRLSVVQFDPDEVDLTKGSPERRRRFLDYTLSLGSGRYFSHLLQYRRAVAQKNRLLKHRRGLVSAEIDVWDQELARNGTPLLLLREDMLPALELASRASYAALAAEGGEISLRVESTVLEPGLDRSLPETVERRFVEVLKESREHERRVGHCLVGPHRDRLEVDLRGQPIRRFGSQGEMRSASIALKLAQAELIFQNTQERPAVFLDDIFSELDRRRTGALQHRLHLEHQLFIATARVDHVLGMADWPGLRAWYVEEGRVTPLSSVRDAIDLMGDTHVVD